MRFARYIWPIFCNSVLLVVILLSYSLASSSYEQMLLAGIAFLLVQIWGLKAQMADGFLATHRRQNAFFLRLAELLKDEELEEFKNATEELAQLERKVRFDYALASVFVWLVSLSAIIAAVSAIAL